VWPLTSACPHAHALFIQAKELSPCSLFFLSLLLCASLQPIISSVFSHQGPPVWLSETLRSFFFLTNSFAVSELSKFFVFRILCQACPRFKGSLPSLSPSQNPLPLLLGFRKQVFFLLPPSKIAPRFPCTWVTRLDSHLCPILDPSQIITGGISHVSYPLSLRSPPC